MKKLLIIICVVVIGCNSYNNHMNELLRLKKNIEIKIDNNLSKDQEFRNITGYREMDDSLYIDKTYPHPELVDSIHGLKQENIFLEMALKKVNYSIDSLQKLK